MTPITAQAIAALDGERLWADLHELAQFGARDDGGVARLTLDDNDIQARLWLAEQARELGGDMQVDPLGNVFVHLPGSAPDLPPITTGSHLDSQPTGGKYDGAYGVLAGMAALRAIRETGIQPRHSLEVVSWTNEEGVRFAPGTSGSACFAGVRSEAETRALTDAEGITFGEALDTCLARLDDAGVERRPLGTPMQAFIEMHIEQGPILERRGASTGIVTGIQGVSWFECEVRGTANHAGTTPRAARQDALEGACALATALRNVACDDADRLRFTIGRFQVFPGSVNTIPERVLFTIDLRHPDASTLGEFEARFQALAVQEWAGCTATLTPLSRIDPVTFPTGATHAIAEAAGELGQCAPRLVSGAFHDAIHLAGHCPTGMIFIPCQGGISHHPSECINAHDATAGARLLTATLCRLACSP
ncbi:M20 family metallo-hydrolase [Aidingimonas lacisalsi]|uniref:M20 family metallo-hydrolase n=1 Tax=Aidingimonas lacisalsi TaxID=2604086 RepID=UPI0011D28536|nr:M20 family metallo-hydrolase [Aidingimonas lacisalsi]